MRFSITGILFLLLAALSSAQTPHSAVVPPSLISKFDPEYSEEARHAKVQSDVTLRFVVKADGKVEDIRVVKGAGFGLDEAAIAAVAKWQFNPGTIRGVAVYVVSRVVVNFTLLPGRNQPPAPSARLNFTLPEGTSRPQLLSGGIPRDLPLLTDQSVNLHLRVDSDGVPQDVTVLSSTDKEWEQQTLQIVQGWRFSAAMLNGAAVAVDGVFELAWKPPPAAALPQK